MRNILEAALYGAIGGVVGALLGQLLALIIPGARTNATVKMLPVVVLVVLSIQFADDLLRPFVGDLFPETASESSEIDDAIAIVEAESPLIAAAFERDPAAREQFRAAMSEILRTSNSQAVAERRAYDVGAQLAQEQLSIYLPRARDDDLIAFAETTMASMRHLAATDPVACYNYLYYPAGFREPGAADLQTALGEERMGAEQRAGATLIRNAYDAVPPYDETAAAAVIEAASTAMLADLPDEKISLLNGGRPAEPDDAAMACAASITLYQTILDSDAPADSIRHLFNSF